jgi:hypothetical protein
VDLSTSNVDFHYSITTVFNQSANNHGAIIIEVDNQSGSAPLQISQTLTSSEVEFYRDQVPGVAA